MDADKCADFGNTRTSILIGSLIFLLFLALSFNFSRSFRSFYQDDNVVSLAPLLIDAARQVLNGNIPRHTFYVGGGGGTPLITILQPGVLNPFGLFPALLLHDYPELLVNTILCLHLSLFAAGGWFLARCLGAPIWAGLCAALSLGFSGFYWVMGGYWMAHVIPYAFLPWLIGCVVALSTPDRPRHPIVLQIVMGLSVLCLFVSGAPNPALYSAPVVFCYVLAVLIEDKHRLRPLLIRLVPQILLFLTAIVPLLRGAFKVYQYYGRVVTADVWTYFSIPLQAYIGMLFPGTYSVWTLNFGGQALMTNILLGGAWIPAWFVLARAFQKPAALVERGVVPFTAGVILFMLILSPQFLGLQKFFSEISLLNAFRFPIRGIPAFQMLVVGLFLILAIRMPVINRNVLKVLLLVGCVGLGACGLVHELIVAKEKRMVFSWFNLMQTSRYDDPDGWREDTIKKLQSEGYLLCLCRTKVYYSKPRIFFHGNLGAQYRVRTVGSYVFDGQSEARTVLRMTNNGTVISWERAKDFLALSPAAPLPEKVLWANGIGPQSFHEMASKTYVSSVVVERGWQEPRDYFSQSPEWRLLEENEWASVFIRKHGSG